MHPSSVMVPWENDYIHLYSYSNLNNVNSLSIYYIYIYTYTCTCIESVQQQLEHLVFAKTHGMLHSYSSIWHSLGTPSPFSGLFFPQTGQFSRTCQHQLPDHRRTSGLSSIGFGWRSEGTRNIMEDHPIGCKWLITMVSKSPNWGYSPSK